jgi:manganese/zinc/iron transport system permease protein
MSARDTTLIAVIAGAAVVVAAVVFKELRLLCFDADYARSLGWSSLLLDGILLAMVTAVTVTGLYAVGAILMVALLVIPPAAARFWTHRLLPMMLVAAAVGGLGCYFGAAASALLADLPTGPAIVIACGTLFIVSLLAAPRRGLAAAALRHLRLKRTVARQHLLRALHEHGDIVGDLMAPVSIEALSARRRWHDRELPRTVARLRRGGFVAAAGDGVVLTPRGRDAARRIVRSHRLWEFYLTSHADIAPSHVDHCADDIEHVLGDQFVAKLEAALRASGELPDAEPAPGVPRSLHTLGGRGTAS